MDDLLIEHDEIEGEYSSPSKEISPNVIKIELKSPERRGQHNREITKKHHQTASDTTPIKSRDTRIGMMYTCPTAPDSPEPNIASNSASALPPLSYKFDDGHFSDKVKCVVTTILFLGVVVMIVVVAVYKNPEM